MNLGDDLKRDLERDEGRKPTVYLDTKGIPTFGIGHNGHVALSDRVIDLIFDDDVARASLVLTTYCPWWTALDVVRQRAMLELAFNLGGRLLEFHRFLDAMRCGAWTVAHDELVHSVWHTQVQPSRRDHLERMILTGKD